MTTTQHPSRAVALDSVAALADIPTLDAITRALTLLDTVPGDDDTATISKCQRCLAGYLEPTPGLTSEQRAEQRRLYVRRARDLARRSLSTMGQA